MIELNELINPLWGAQKEIVQIWNQINAAEKQLIKTRMDALFKNGLPFELKHEKIVYIQLFSFIAQLDVVACQIPLKFEASMPSPLLQTRLRAQLLDEIFHVLLSIQIVNILSSPYQSPPIYNESLAQFCDLISKEECPKIAVALVNSVFEAVAEELVKELHAIGFAPEVLGLIVADERRHVSDAELYRELGLPDQKAIAAKWANVEDFLLSSMLIQYQFIMTLIAALGPQGMQDYLLKVDANLKEQLKTFNVKPSKKWLASMQLLNRMQLPKEKSSPVEIEKTIHRKEAMTQWRDPVDPTMVGQFNIDISCLDFFNKKYPPETLTTLMLQTLSQALADNPEHQLFLHNDKLYQRQVARVGLVVELPDCNNHLAVISIQDCHNLSVESLSIRIRQILGLMVYCFKKRELLEQNHPHLKKIQSQLFSDIQNPFSKISLPISPGVCLSNIGACGYSQGLSPLLPNESCKITLFEVEKRLVWLKDSNSFEPRDLLPVSFSADHRIFDGQIPTPKIMAVSFDKCFTQMEQGGGLPLKMEFREQDVKSLVDNLIETNLDLAYLALMMLQTIWPDFLSLHELFKTN